MIPAFRNGLKSVFQYGAGFCRAGAIGGLASVEALHLPGRFVHDGFKEYGFDIQVAWTFRRDFAHGCGESDIPCGHLVHIVCNFPLGMADG